MSLEADLFALWSPLVNGRFTPDVPPDVPVYPLMFWQQVGGRSLWFSNRQMPGHRHARIQLHVWSGRRLDTNTIARAAEKALCESPLIAEPFGAPTALYEPEMKIYGTRHDFGIWYPDP